MFFHDQNWLSIAVIIDFIAKFSIVFVVFRNYTRLTMIQFVLCCLFFTLISMRMEKHWVYVAIGCFQTFIKGLNNINLITAMLEDNRIKYQDKEIGFIMTSLIVSLFSTLATVVYLTLNNI